MKCPVCKNKIDDENKTCPICKFDDLHHYFINTNDATEWMEKIVVPYRNQWNHKPKTETGDLFQTMFSKQLERLNTISNEHIERKCDFRYHSDSNGVVISSYIGSNSHVTIPDTIDGNLVRGIGDSAFKDNKIIETVTLPNTIRFIGNEAFSKSSIKTIDLGESVKYIYSHAFYSCNNLESITFPETVKIISNGVCSSCSKLKNVVILGARKIEIGAFLCEGLKRIYLPDTLEEIEAYSFTSPCRFKQMILPQSLQKLNDTRFILHNNGLDIAVLNNNTEFAYEHNDLYDGNTRIFCNKGSLVEVFANKYMIPTFPLSKFQKC